MTHRLTVLSWGGGWGAALRAAVSDRFERETGIRVEHRPHIGLELPNEVDVDVVWSNAVPALKAAARGECAKLDPMPAFAKLRARAFPRGGGDDLYVIHPYVVYYVLAYHEEAFPAGPPRSWGVLLDPSHRRKIALYPGGNGLYPIAQVLGGGRLEDIPHDMTACWSFLRSLHPQVGELGFSVGMEERLRRRELDLCFRALTNALAFRAAGVPVGFCVPREGTTDTLDALWIPARVHEPQRTFAMRFIELALRADVQEDWCERLGAMPMHRAAAIPTMLRDRPELPMHADDTRGILQVSEQLKVRHEDEWKARFASIFSD